MANPSIDSDYQIATFAGGVGALVTLASLSVPNPHPVYTPGVATVKLGDNSARLLGAPSVAWHWGYLTQAQRDVLRGYCVGASAPVYITTVTTEKVSSVPNAAANFLAQMIWPAPATPEDPQTGRRLDFILIFRQLVAQ